MLVLLRIIGISLAAFLLTIFIVVLGGEVSFYLALGVFITCVVGAYFGIKAYLAKV